MLIKIISKKKEDSFLNKKRKDKKEDIEEIPKEEIKEDIKEENDKKNQENSPNAKKPEEGLKVNDDNSKQDINEKNNEKSYIIDDSLKNVITVKQQNEHLMAVVNRLNENGEIIKDYILTTELRKSNPWILLDFYESKIKFI